MLSGFDDLWPNFFPIVKIETSLRHFPSETISNEKNGVRASRRRIRISQR